MLKKLTPLLLVFCVLYVSSCTSLKKEIAQMPSGKYELDKAHSSVHFRVKHLGLSFYTARFTDFDANLDFNSQKPHKSALTAVIKADSIRTDFPFLKRKDFDRLLAYDKSWFNAKKYPEIKFEAKSIARSLTNKSVIKGDLTMLGVTKPVDLEVQFNGSYKNKPFANVPALGFSAKANIKRSDWGFDTFVPNIGDDVEIIIETEFHKAG